MQKQPFAFVSDTLEINVKLDVLFFIQECALVNAASRLVKGFFLNSMLEED
jgi:hypothetical protein